MDKTLEKLKTICQAHKVIFELSYDPNNQNYMVIFDAPQFSTWRSNDTPNVTYHSKTVRGVIGFINKELKIGMIDKRSSSNE